MSDKQHLANVGINQGTVKLDTPLMVPHSRTGNRDRQQLLIFLQ